MKILVVSDTHGMWRRIVEAYEKESAVSAVDMILHAGDHLQDLRCVKEFLEIGICGCEGDDIDEAELFEEDMSVDIEGVCEEGSYVKGLNVRAEIPVFVGVKGNCDGDKYVEGVDFLKIIEFRDKRIILTHGHKEGVKSGLYTLYCKGLEMEADIVVYGHTHIPAIEKDDRIVLMNPGSLVIPKAGMLPSYGVIEYDEIDGEFAFFIKNI